MDTGVTLDGRYRLVDRIGAGGMGSVWEADDLRLERRVAVKLPTEGPARDRQHLQRFIREARTAARLSHPNVATVLDHGHDGEAPFIVMELLDGETLADRLERGPIPPDETIRIAQGIAAALDAAHAAGVVHRDVKPSNVMLTESGVKVMDFGVAAATWAPTITATGIVGTAAYLSPERAVGEPAVPGSDVYALGVVVFEMLAGRPPFVAESPVAVVAAHVHREPPSLVELAPGVPDHVVRAVEHALAKDPAGRPPTATAFVRLLGDPDATPAGEHDLRRAETRVLGDPAPTRVLPPVRAAEPVPARSGGTADPRDRAWVRPAWMIAALLGLALLGLVGATVARDDGGPASAPTTIEGPVATVVPATIVTVPDLVGQPVEMAIDSLQGAGLVVGDVRLAGGPSGAVIGIEPAEGSTVPYGTRVVLTAGTGSAAGPGTSGDVDDEGDDRRAGTEGGGRENGRPSCDTDPDHPSCD